MSHGLRADGVLKRDGYARWRGGKEGFITHSHAANWNSPTAGISELSVCDAGSSNGAATWFGTRFRPAAKSRAPYLACDERTRVDWTLEIPQEIWLSLNENGGLY